MTLEALRERLAATRRNLDKASGEGANARELELVELIDQALDELSFAQRVVAEHVRAREAERSQLESSAIGRLMDAADVSYLRTTLDGVILGASEHAAVQLQVERRSLVGRPVAAFVPASRLASIFGPR
ncbi:MAG: hypothetical protein ABR606_14045 [Vicinamibacterales bacterium]